MNISILFNGAKCAIYQILKLFLIVNMTEEETAVHLIPANYLKDEFSAGFDRPSHITYYCFQLSNSLVTTLNNQIFLPSLVVNSSPLISTCPNTPEVWSRRKIYSCYLCNRVYTRSSTLKVHMRKHTGEKPYTCKVCYKSFFEKGNLTTHERIHTGQKPFECMECHKRFTTQGHLTDHSRRHSNTRPFNCETCGKNFMRTSTLKIHIRRHTGDRPFKCEECGKCFTESGNLKTHSRIHSGERPYKCQFAGCLKAFKTKGHLVDHHKTKMHQDY